MHLPVRAAEVVWAARVEMASATAKLLPPAFDRDEKWQAKQVDAVRT